MYAYAALNLLKDIDINLTASSINTEIYKYRQNNGVDNIFSFSFIISPHQYFTVFSQGNHQSIMLSQKLYPHKAIFLSTRNGKYLMCLNTHFPL